MDILRRIIDMDKAASERCAAAVERERGKSDEFGERTAREREDMVALERKRVEELVREQDKKLAEKLSKAQKQRDEECAKLDERFNANKDKWKKEIIGRITGC